MMHAALARILMLAIVAGSTGVAVALPPIEAVAAPAPRAAAKPAVPAAAKPAAAEPAAAEPAVALPGYMRVVDRDDRLGLEIAVREFERPDGSGPRVGLVAVAHIGEHGFYDQLQEVLDSYDVVLYESVLPPGARGPEGDTDQLRADSTMVAMRFVASLIEAYRMERGDYPADLRTFQTHLRTKDDRLAGWSRAAMVDAWDRLLRYRPRLEADGFVLTSLGADGEEGGAGPDADLVVSSADGIEPLRLDDSGNLQAELAATLGLAFQLEAIDYGDSTWRCSDMAMDQVAQALAERGIQFEPLAGALTGSSLPAKVIQFLLRLVRVADAFLGGVIADTCKVTLIEMLGDEALVEQSLDEMGDGFAEVIVEMRNQVAIDDLQTLIEDEPDVETVAIFYGAAHMPDLERRLGKMGYRRAAAVGPADSPPARWLRAIEVDLARSQVSRRDVAQIRAMMKNMR